MMIKNCQKKKIMTIKNSRNHKISKKNCSITIKIHHKLSYLNQINLNCDYHENTDESQNISCALIL